MGGFRETTRVIVCTHGELPLYLTDRNRRTRSPLYQHCGFPKMSQQEN